MGAIEKQPTKTEVEQTAEKLKEKHFMHAHFIDGLLRGEFRELPEEEIEEIATEHFLGFEPLTQLDDTQEELLRGRILRHLDGRLNTRAGGRLEKLCGQVFTDGTTLFVGDSEALNRREEFDIEKVRVLSLEEKLDLFFDPVACHTMPYFECKSGQGAYRRRGWNSYGNRGLEEYMRTEEFDRIVAEIRERTGRKELKVLDIGCGMGKALQDIKERDLDIETHGVTMEQELGMYEVDNFYFHAAERLPANFKGKFDLIFSNVSFRYYLFQHIALRNAVLALAEGGIAHLSVACDSIPYGDKYDEYFRELVQDMETTYGAMRVLLRREFEKLKELERAGKIKLTIHPYWGEDSGEGIIIIEKVEDFDADEFEKQNI